MVADVVKKGNDRSEIRKKMEEIMAMGMYPNMLKMKKSYWWEAFEPCNALMRIVHTFHIRQWLRFYCVCVWYQPVCEMELKEKIIVFYILLLFRRIFIVWRCDVCVCVNVECADKRT